MILSMNGDWDWDQIDQVWNIWDPQMYTNPYIYIYWLVVWNIFYFPIYWEESFHLTFIFFRGVGQPPTRYIHIYIYCVCIYIYPWMEIKTEIKSISYGISETHKCILIHIYASMNWLCLMDAGWEVGVSIRRLIDFGHLHGGRRQATERPTGFGRTAENKRGR
jgi:hypothetical protein